jgi:hypothetical protein
MNDSDNPWRTFWYATDPSYLTVRVTFTKSDETVYHHALECHKSQFTTEEMQKFERDLDKGWAGWAAPLVTLQRWVILTVDSGILGDPFKTST